MAIDTNEKINYLRMIDVFQSLSKAEMAEMDRTTTMSTCQRGKIFYHPEVVPGSRFGQVLALSHQRTIAELPII